MAWLTEAAAQVEHLECVVIIRLPDCTGWAEYSRGGLDTGEIAAYFGDIARANRNALKIVGEHEPDLGLILETGTRLVLCRDLSPRFVIAAVFANQLPLGLARMRLKALAKATLAHLPTDDVAQKSRAERILDFLTRYAPDPHTVPLRLSLQTGIALDALHAPGDLDPRQTERLEAAARSLLGLEHLRI